MALNAKTKEYTNTSNKVAQPPLEAGSYPARLVQVIDLGVQEQQPWNNEPAKPPVQEIMVTYELVDAFMVDEDGNEIEDKPRWLSETFPLYNLESELAKSTKRYLAIDPNVEMDGDWTALIGWPVMVTLVQNPGKGKNKGKIYEKITGTSSVRARDAAKLPELKNPGKVFDQSDLDTVGILLTLPKWVQDKVKEGLEWEGSPMAKAVENYKGEANENAKESNTKKGSNKKAAKPEPEDDDGEAPFDTDSKSGDDGEEW
jgi:hypothetical protein